MNINGEFILREVVGEHVLIPVGDTALHFNGLISLTPVAALIWTAIQAGKTQEEILAQILEEYEVTPQEAETDLEEFLNLLKEQNLLV